MLIREFYYLEQNGYHLPDTAFGSEQRYAVDLACWIETELISEITSVEWRCQNHLHLVEEGVPIVSSLYEAESRAATVIIKAPCRGTYRLTCTITGLSKGEKIVKVIALALKVY